MNLRVRKKKNASGSISVQILDRTNRGYKVVETIGCSFNDEEIEKFYKKALERINELSQIRSFILNFAYFSLKLWKNIQSN